MVKLRGKARILWVLLYYLTRPVLNQCAVSQTTETGDFAAT
jgi:hypothetical protein